MSATTTITETSPDISITKTELFDVEFARWIVENKAIPKDDRTMVSRYLKNRVRGNEHDTTYKLGKLCKGEFLGRFCAIRGESLQCFSRDIRNALAMKYYWDIDMINAQPVILSQYCEKQGWVCDALKKYVAQREEMLTLISDACNIERWEAKQRVVSILFGAGVDGDMPAFFREDFAREMRSVMKNNWSSQFKWLEKQPNPYGRAIAYTLQTEERKCLMAMDKSLLRHKRSFDVLIHDGGLVRKKMSESCFPESLLREVEKDVLAETGYSISLSVKPMATSLEMETDGTEEEYKQMKEDFEKSHFKVELPFTFVRLDGKEMHQYNQTELQGCYGNLLLSDGSSFIAKWLKDPQMRTYKTLIYRPKQQTPDNTFNIFTGFEVEATAGDVSVIRDVLRLVSGDDPVMMEYIENWCAWILQKPCEKTKTAIVVSGEQGVGKDTYFDFIGELMGRQFFLNTSRPEEDIFGKFNGHLKKVLLVKCEEAQYLVNKQNGETLKSLITTDKQAFQDKGAKTITLDCFFNFVMTTNQEVPVPIEQTNRRYVLVRASSEKRGDHAYWKRVHTELAKPETKSAYMDYLLKKDISNFNPVEFPETEYYQEVKQSFAPYHAKWFQEFVCRQGEEGENVEYSFTASDLLRQMKEGLRFDLNATQLGRALKVYPPEVLNKKSTKFANTYTMTSGNAMRDFLIKQKWWVEL